MIYDNHRMIIVSPSLGAAAEALLAYGKGVVDVTDVLVVITEDDTLTLQSLGVPLTTPWCRVDGAVAIHVLNFMRAQFGPSKTIAACVNAHIDGIAIDPRAKRVDLPPPVPEVFNQFHQSVESIPTLELREDGTVERREDGTRELRDGQFDVEPFGPDYDWSAP